MLGVPEGDKHGDRSVASLPDVIDKTNMVGQARFVVCPLTKERPGKMPVLSGAGPQKKEP